MLHRTGALRQTVDMGQERPIHEVRTMSASTRKRLDRGAALIDAQGHRRQQERWLNYSADGLRGISAVCYCYAAPEFI